MPENVGVRVPDSPQHARCHLTGLHTQFGVDARDNHIEEGEQLLVLVERTIFEDVDLDAGQDAKGRDPLVQLHHHAKLLYETLLVQTVGNGEAWAVIGQSDVVMAECLRGQSHLLDRAAAV
jgi:hypothetical protein